MSAKKALTKLKSRSNVTGTVDNSDANVKKQVTISKFFAATTPQNESQSVVIDDSSRSGSSSEIKIPSPVKKRRRKDDTNFNDSKVKKQCVNGGELRRPGNFSETQDLQNTGNNSKSPELGLGAPLHENDSGNVETTREIQRPRISENTKFKLQKFESDEIRTNNSQSEQCVNDIKDVTKLSKISSDKFVKKTCIDLTMTPDASCQGNSDDDIDLPSTSMVKTLSSLSKFSHKSEGSVLTNTNRSQKCVVKPTKYTPLEQQFVDIKAKYPDAVLFVECGYKYRFFGQDAEIAAEVLKIYCHLDHSFMTASIPTHRLFVHVRRLVAAGYKVGVVKQMETAALKAAGENRAAPFTRELSALYTKSTLIGEDVDPLFGLEETGDSTCGNCTSYLMCVYETPPDPKKKQQTCSTAVFAIQPSTGDVMYDYFEDNDMNAELETRLSHIQPTEILLPHGVRESTETFINRLVAISSTDDDRMRIEKIDDKQLEYNSAFQTVSDFYRTDTSRLQEVLDLPRPVISCLAGVIAYLTDFSLHRSLTLTSNFTQFSVRSKYMQLPGKTVRNLEMFQNQTNSRERGSLFWVVNQTVTRFGGRMLRMWLSRPLLSVRDIRARQTAIQDLVDGPCAENLAKLRAVLGRVPDVEKGLTAIYHKKCSVLEFYSVCKALAQLHKEVLLLAGTQCPLLTSDLLQTILTAVPDLLQDIGSFVSSLRETAVRNKDKTDLFADETQFPVIVQSKQGIEDVMSELQSHRRDVRLVLRQPALTYVTVMGTEFLIEVKNSCIHTVPQKWSKISSTKAVSRFHSPFIEKAYKRLQQLREQLKIDCHQAWLDFLSLFGENYQRYKKAVHHLATLDCLFSLAATAKHHGYCRPEIVEDDEFCIRIENGRHPIIQQLIVEREQYVPNDTTLQKTGERVMIITGPNMGGKSSYIKQVALITVLAQIGSYVPADSARIGVVDAVYTRMGASDEIYSRRSTFMVELQEASDIMARATDRSLVILDELGRGTSTHDGTAIAHATLDYFIQKVGCFCLFVTHYPILAEFESQFPGVVKNFHMSFFVSEDEESGSLTSTDSITFLYQLVSGVAGRSYGLNVARLAGIPHNIIQGAAHRSHDLETSIADRRDQLKLFQALSTCPDGDMYDILRELESDDLTQVSSS